MIKSLSLIPVATLFIACGEPAPPDIEVPEIRVVEVVQRDQAIHAELVGETLGSLDVPIRARVEGVVLGLHFAEGKLVAEGDLLYTIDPAPYEVQVVEAEGQLAEAQVRLANNQAELERIRPLADIGAVSQIDLDASIARVEAAVSAVRSAQARVDGELIRLGYTNISAPISGRIGISAAKAGEFVGRAPNPIVLNSISAIDPIRVRFALDERNYLRLARERVTEGDDETREGSNFELILADGTTHNHKGHLVATDARIDPDTGTFTLEAEFPNPDQIVLSGQFARVRVEIDFIEDAILVPQRAIRDLQGITQVYVVDAEGRVNIRAIEVGNTVDRLQIVSNGLDPGERVAVEIARLRGGMMVDPQLIPLNPDGSFANQPGD